jgi:RNA polymerase sigma factor (sigma-70 family)
VSVRAADIAHQTALGTPLGSALGTPLDRPDDLDALFRQYARELNGFAFRRLNDREAAADVVQDGFLRYLVWHRARTKPTTASDARNVLWTVVSNLTIDFIRQKRSRGTSNSLEFLADRLVDPHPTPDRIIEGRQAYRRLKAALDESPRAQRTALLLNRVEGLTHAEIAERMGVSASMVSKYIMAVLDRCLIRIYGAVD